MADELSHEQLQDLLGAFAINATDAHEAAAIRAHLIECPRCRAEVADLRDTAASLGYSGAEAPPGVWEKIAAALDEAPPPLRLVPAGASPQRRAKMLRMLGVAAAVTLLLGVSVTALVRTGTNNGATHSTLDGVVIAALTDPKAVQVHLASSSERYSAVVVLLPGGAGYLVRHNLPALPPDRTYQLWGQVGNTQVSLGVLGSHPDTSAFVANAKLVALAITEETAGGVVQPTRPPVVAGLVTTRS
jgi:anti-sigma factor RsiW